MKFNKSWCSLFPLIPGAGLVGGLGWAAWNYFEKTGNELLKSLLHDTITMRDFNVTMYLKDVDQPLTMEVNKMHFVIGDMLTQHVIDTIQKVPHDIGLGAATAIWTEGASYLLLAALVIGGCVYVYNKNNPAVVEEQEEKEERFIL